MRLVSKLKNSESLKRILYYLIAFFLFVYVFSVPSFGESKSFLRYSIYISMILLGCLVFVFCLLYDNFRINKAAFLIPAFCLFSLIGTLLYSHQFRAWLSIVLLTISFFVFIYSFKILKNKYLIVSIIAISFFLFSLYYVVFYRKEILDFRSYTSDTFRLGWYFDNPNGVSSYAVIGFSAPLYLILFWNKKIRFAFIVPALTSLLVGATTGSRTFLVIVAVIALIFSFFKFKNHKLIFVIVTLSLIVVGILLLNMPFLSTMKERLLKAIQTLFGTASKVDTSTLERAVMIDYGFLLGSKRLFFGYGVDGFSVVSGMGTYAHSNFAEVVCDFGLFGLVLFYLPLLVFFIKAISSKKIDKSFVITFFVYYVIVSFSNVFYYKKIYYLMIAFLFYLVYVEASESKIVALVPELKTVAFTCDSMGSGGAEKVISVLANQMSKNNISVTIIGVADANVPNSFYQLSPSVKYINLRNSKGKNPKGITRVFALRETLKTISPNVVISFLPNANVYTWLSLVGLKVPHIVSERNNPKVNPKGKLLRILKKLSFIFADGCVFQTNDAKEYFPKAIQRKSIIIKNPIDIKIDSFNSNSPRNNTVLAVGRLIEQKNYKCLFNAFKLFSLNSNERYILKIYGDGPLKNELISYCNTLGISNNVIFVGNDPDWHAKEYNDAMYVLSSDYEGMPNSLAEAMALGIPCISTDCPIGGSRELINDSVNGFLVPVNNSQELSNKMLKLIHDKTLRFYENTRSMIDDYSPISITTKWTNYILNLKVKKYE